MNKVIFLIIINLIFAYANSAEFYIQKSKDINLHKEQYWKTLLHISSTKSEIDNSEFFLSRDGKYNPLSEMNATIRGMFDNNNTICRYPARYYWLKEKLDIKELPFPKCKEYEEFIKTVDPKSVTLVFPAAHISSPASMFGHTFLRIDSSYESKMLSSAINYSANANQDTENGVVFAIKGLFGGYSGQYSLLPYYDKLKEYRDKDQRDMWEYKLNLTNDETLKMVRHIWELKDTRSDYFFFDENCAYNMLWLIEAARDGVSLRDDFTYHVSPPETLFAVKDSKLIESSQYRPSKRTKQLAYEKKMTKIEKRIAKNMLKERRVSFDANLTTASKIDILELLVELNEDDYVNKRVSKDEYLAYSHQLLLARSKLGVGDNLSIKEPKNPLKAHRQFKTTLQGEIKDDKQNILFGFRPVYHDLNDNDAGMIDGSEIKFMDFLFRANRDSVKLESLNVLSLSSLVNVSEFSKPFSWSAAFLFDRKSPNENLNFDSSVNIGYRKNIFDDRCYIYAFGVVGANEYENWNAYVGYKSGLIWSENEYMKLNIGVNHRKFTNGFVQLKTDVTQNFYINQNISLGIGYEHIGREHIGDSNIFRVIANYYF